MGENGQWWPDEDERRVYLALLALWRGAAADVAAAAELPEVRVRALLDSLACHRLVRAEGGQWTPLPPGAVLEPMLLAREEAVIDVQRAIVDNRRLLDDLHEQWQHAQARRGPEAIVRLLRGPAEIQEAYDANLRTTRSEVLAMARPPMLRLPITVDEAELGVIRSGVRWRTLYQADFLELSGAAEFTAAVAAAGEAGRVATRVPMKLMIHDRRTALVPLEATEPGLKHALLVSSSMLLEALVSLFEVLWDAAAPLHGEEPAADAEVDPILPLLAAGLKDEAIARKLGCGVRTVRRRIADAMESLGARTRFQAGFDAARRGWPVR
jgi:hypothetical protein